MRIYVGGPMRGVPLYNWPAFDATADVLRQLGLDVTNPADLDRAGGFDATTVVDRAGFEACLARDLAQLRECDAMVLLPRWEASEGATRERQEAQRLGLRVFGSLRELIELAALPGEAVA